VIFDAIEMHAALEGSYEREVAEGKARVAYASVMGITDVAGDYQVKLQQDFVQSHLGRGAQLSKTWRRKVYRNKGLNPAALLFSSMPAVVQAFEEGATITVNGKRGALYPNPEVWGGRIKRPTGRGARAASTFAIGKRRFGALQFIPTKGSSKLVGVFVAKLDRVQRGQGRFRKAGVRALKKGLFDNVVVFWVLHEPRLPKLLHGREIRARFARNFPGDMQHAFDRRLAETENGPRLIPAGVDQ
jgi:hypothetical protein